MHDVHMQGLLYILAEDASWNQYWTMHYVCYKGISVHYKGISVRYKEH